MLELAIPLRRNKRNINHKTSWQIIFSFTEPIISGDLQLTSECVSNKLTTVGLMTTLVPTQMWQKIYSLKFSYMFFI